MYTVAQANKKSTAATAPQKTVKRGNVSLRRKSDGKDAEALSRLVQGSSPPLSVKIHGADKSVPPKTPVKPPKPSASLAVSKSPPAGSTTQESMPKEIKPIPPVSEAAVRPPSEEKKALEPKTEILAGLTSGKEKAAGQPKHPEPEKPDIKKIPPPGTKKEQAKTMPTAGKTTEKKETKTKSPQPSPVEKEAAKAATSGVPVTQAEKAPEAKEPATPEKAASKGAVKTGPPPGKKASAEGAAAKAPEAGGKGEKSPPAAAEEKPAVEKEVKESPARKAKKGEKEKKKGDKGGAKKSRGVRAKLLAAGAKAFSKAKERIQELNTNEKTHKPVDEKMEETKKAVVPPTEEAQSRSNAKQVEAVEKKAAPKPSKEDAKSAMSSALKRATPDTLEEMDEFKSRGKARGIRDSVLENVQGQVKGVQATYEEIGNAPEAEPPSAENPPIPEAELAPETPALALGEELVPQVSKEDVDMGEFEDEVEQQIAAEGVPVDVLEQVDSGPLAEAMSNRKSLKKKVDTGPGELRQHEQKEKAAMRQELESDEQAVRGTMKEGRKTQLNMVKEKQGAAKKSEEEKRKQVTTNIQNIYNKAKTSVETKLSNLETDSLKRFDEGQKKASDKFEDTVKSDLEDLKDERYSGAFGWASWLEDKLLGMDDLPEVKAIFDDAKDTFITEIDKLIDNITKDANKVIEDCKKEIQDAKVAIKKYVDSLGPDLKKAAEATAKDMTDKLDQLEKDVNKKAEELRKKLAQKREQAIKAIDEKIEKMKEDLKGLAGMIGDLLLQAAMKLFEWALKAIGAPVQKIIGSLKRAGSSFKKIIDDPIGFLGNLLSAMGKGFKQFSTNILTHLKQGLMGWLFGTMAKAGITMPKEFSIKGILGLVLQILGLTPERLKQKAAKYIGEKNVERIMKVWEFISAFIKGGIGGLWELIKEHLTNLKEMVIGAIQDWLITQIIKQAVIWIVSLFNPVAAIVKAIQAIYKVVMFIIERIQQILEVMEAILGSLAEIASGAIGKAANWIEKTLGRLVPVVIGFLASLLGLGGISGKIKEIVTKIQSKVDKAIDKVIAKVAAKVGKLFGKGKPEGAKKDPNKSPEEQAREQRKKEAIAEARAAMKKGIRRKALKKLLVALKKKHKLKSAVLTNKDDVIITNSPEEQVKGEAVEHDIRVSEASDEGRRKKLAEGGQLIGKFRAVAPVMNTARGALSPHVKEAFPYPDMPSTARRPSRATADLHGGVHGIDRVSGAAGLKNVNDFGRIESRLRGKGIRDYESGHLIANEFGGNDNFENLVPQRGDYVNRGVYRDIENWVRKQLPDMPKTAQDKQQVALTMNVTPSYGGSIKIPVSEAARALNIRVTEQYHAARASKEKAAEKLAQATPQTEEHEKAKKSSEHWEKLLASAQEKKALGEAYERSATVDTAVEIPSRIPTRIDVDVTFNAKVDDTGSLTAEEKQKTEFKDRKVVKQGKEKASVSSDPVVILEGASKQDQRSADSKNAGTKPKTKDVKAQKKFTVK